MLRKDIYFSVRLKVWGFSLSCVSYDRRNCTHSPVSRGMSVSISLLRQIMYFTFLYDEAVHKRTGRTLLPGMFFFMQSSKCNHTWVHPFECHPEKWPKWDIFDRLWYPLSILLLTAIVGKLIGPHGGL